MSKCILILADIHANLEAFESVLEDAEKHRAIDEVWCLGDIVGYGPDPVECIQLIRKTGSFCVAGNHDLAAAGMIETTDFNPQAEIAIKWTGQQLGDGEIDYLRKLPYVLKRDDFTLVHGSPRDPVSEYLSMLETATMNFSFFKTGCCLVGHTHQPRVFKQIQNPIPTVREIDHNIVVSLIKNRFIINPGAVGQPRDGDPRASYALLDEEAKEISFYRVAYDITAVQGRMIKYGLPTRLIERLSHGT